MLDFSEDQKLAQKAIRAWCRTKLEPNVPKLESCELSIYPLMREFAGTFGIPDLAKNAFSRMKEKPDGGAKGSFGDTGMMSIVMIELSRCCPGFAMAFGATLGLFGGAVLARGTWEQKERWALPVFTLEKIGAWALTEPGAGSDAFGSMRTVARKADRGWRLSGQKTFITNAPYADQFVVYAKVEDGDVRAFIVERSAQGVATGAPFKKMGMHASPTGEVFLDDVFVPDDQVLGGDGAKSARDAAKSSLSQERFGMTPMCVGIVERCLEEAVKYAKERQQWGKPIATFQLVQEKIAKIYTARSVMHALLMRQLEAERTGVPLPTAEASASKLYCARTTTECALDAVQVLGGAGYMAGSVVEMLARDAKLFQIGGGTDEIQILRIAREVLGVP
jgi:acyl-CoA dehydrogenase